MITLLKKKNKDTIENKKFEENKSGKETHKDEYGYIVPETEFGKLGLISAQIALTLCGVAGALTGIALRVPIMPVGETVLNILATPIITTPAGIGLSLIGMALIASGRGIETRPELKLSTTMLANQRTTAGRVKYVMQNMGAGLKETADTIKYVSSQAAHLASSNTHAKEEAKHFFKHKFFKIRSSTITMKQNVLANGQTIIESGMKTHSYRLHTFAGITAVGGIILLTEDLLERMGTIKDIKSRKRCINIAKTGQYANNIGLTTYGLERIVKGALILGVPVTVSGLVEIAASSKIEEEDGRGLAWLTLALFFTFLMIERGIEAGLAIRERKNLKLQPKAVMEEFSDFARLFEIDLSKVDKLTKKQLDNILKVVGGQEKAMVRIKEFFSKKAGENAARKMAQETEQAIRELENDPNQILREIPKLVKTLKEDILAGEYKENFNETDLINALKERGFSKEFIDYITQNGIVKVGSQTKNLPDVLSSIHKKNAEQFGTNYAPKLETIINDSNLPDWVTVAAKKARTDFAVQLQKN